MPTTTWLERIPIVYRPDIQQGNIVTQEAVNKLEPGMSKRQVRFVLGTPMLADAFHQDRWDYIYTLTEGWGEREQKNLTVYFEQDSLIKIEGDLRPEPGSADIMVKKDAVVTVPDWVDKDRGILEKAVETVSSAWDDDEGAAIKQEAEIKAIRKEGAVPSAPAN